VESSENAIIGKTLDGTIVSWNKSAEPFYGYNAAEVIGKSISPGSAGPPRRMGSPDFPLKVAALA
jgi:PAS domain S-box-containing protein